MFFMNKTTIGFKIALGFLLVFFIFLMLAIFIIDRLSGMHDSISNLTRISQNSITVLDINKDIADLQRSALVYGQSGTDAIIKKMSLTYDNITDNLSRVQSDTNDRQSKQLIENMQEVVRRYGDNISVLKNRYQFRRELMNIKLPQIRQLGLDYLEQLRNKSALNNNIESQLLISELTRIWLQINLDSELFLYEKEYPLKKSVYSNIQKILKASSGLSQPELRLTNVLPQHNLPPAYDNFYFSDLIRQFKRVFDQAVQANRIYSSLVNVVMAGEAIEFTTLSKKLRQRTIDLLKDISQSTTKNVFQGEQVIKLSLLISAPLVLLIIIYYHTTISRAIRTLADAFNELLQGNLNYAIPGLNRKDEIGELANAANAYKDVGEKLKKEKAKAEEITKIKSEFLANMSHEIRTPMNGILGMVSLLHGTKLNAEQEGMLNTISSSGKSLLTILNDILDLSKVESGKIELEKKSFSLKDLLNELTFTFTNLANEKEIGFSLAIVSERYPEYIIGDVTRLKQILINLLTNAIKFTEQGSVDLQVSCTPLKNKHYDIQFRVIDTGIGISEQAQESLFQAFSQADTSITRKFGGTGLGLTISAKLANLMGSSISLYSSPGKGSIFEFEVTLPEGDKPQKKITNTVKPKFNSDIKILLVEDNPVNIKIASMMITKLGYACDIAENGEQAVEMVKRNNYHMIFMDMQMPVMDGIEATEIIKQLEQGKHVPIIAMTANVFNEDKEKCFQAGMEYFIPKPINISIIEDTIDRVIESEKNNESVLEE